MPVCVVLRRERVARRFTVEGPQSVFVACLCSAMMGDVSCDLQNEAQLERDAGFELKILWEFKFLECPNRTEASDWSITASGAPETWQLAGMC